MDERLKQHILQVCGGLEKCGEHSNSTWIGRVSFVDDEKITLRLVCLTCCYAKVQSRYAKDFTVQQDYYAGSETLTVGEAKPLEASEGLLEQWLLVNTETEETEEIEEIEELPPAPLPEQ